MEFIICCTFINPSTVTVIISPVKVCDKKWEILWGFILIIIMQGFMKVQYKFMVNPRRAYDIFMYRGTVYESEMYSKGSMAIINPIIRFIILCFFKMKYLLHWRFRTLRVELCFTLNGRSHCWLVLMVFHLFRRQHIARLALLLLFALIISNWASKLRWLLTLQATWSWSKSILVTCTLLEARILILWQYGSKKVFLQWWLIRRASLVENNQNW